MMNKNAHGGNIYKKAKEMGIREEDILDFSANISPLGLPDHIKEAMLHAIEGTVNYPDPDCTSLREAIGKADGVSPEHISCGNGGADLLYRIAFGLQPQKALIPVPAFVEYEEALSAAGTRMEYYFMEEDFTIKEDILGQITDDLDFLVICNPNNPTGILTDRSLIFQVLEKAQQSGTIVMIDECFLEICQNEKAYTLKPFLSRYTNLIILKSFTKMYAIPGVRLGYVLSENKEILRKINRAGQAWSVSHIAQCAGVAALEHIEYKQQVIRTVAQELSYMKGELKKLPLLLYDGNANYLFFRVPGMEDLDKRLEQRGIMIRNCSNYVNLGKDYWRIAVKSHPENERLIGELKTIFKTCPRVLHTGFGSAFADRYRSGSE